MEELGSRLSAPDTVETQPPLTASLPWWSVPITLIISGALTFVSMSFSPMLTAIPVCLVLGTALLIPWGLKEQGLLCAVTTLTYTAAVYPHLVSPAAGEFLYRYLGLGAGLLMSLIGVARQQNQRARLARQAAELQGKIDEAEALQEFSRALTAALDRSHLLPALTLAAQRLCHVQSLAIGLLDSAHQGMTIWTQTDPSLNEQQFLLEDTFARDILQVGWPIYIANLTTPPLSARLLQTFHTLGYSSLLIVPLRVAHRVMGVLLVAWRTQRKSLPSHEEELLQLLADQAVQALTNIRLYEEKERHLRESETLRRVGQSISATLNLQDILRQVTEESMHLLGCEAGVLTLCTADNQVEIAGASGFIARWRGRHLLLPGSLTELVIKECRAIRQTEVQEQNLPLSQWCREVAEPLPQAFLAVPLWCKEKPVGALIVLTFTPRPFSLDDERVLQALADQAMHAITNAQLYAELQAALHREQDAYRKQSAFFASASHELRTPLNIILGYTDLLCEGEIGKIDSAAAETLKRVRKAAHHLIDLVNDLLDLARLERAELQLHLERIALEELLQETCTHWEKAITDKGLVFRRVGDHPLPAFVTDKARLRQILDNLLGNAVKFTTVGHVIVGTRVGNDTIELWVEDTGVGIDPKDQERIFDEFQQIEQGMTSQPDGFGLGLAVCKKIVQLLKGDIKVESTPGQGSTFTVILPQHVLEGQCLANGMEPCQSPY